MRSDLLSLRPLHITNRLDGIKQLNMDKQLIFDFVDEIVHEEYAQEVEVYEFEKNDALEALSIGEKLDENKQERFMNGFGIPEPGLLSWIPIFYTTFLIVERSYKFIYSKESNVTLKQEFKDLLITNGMSPKEASKVSSKFWKKLQSKIIDKM